MSLRLAPLETTHAELLVSWARAAVDADRWASVAVAELTPGLIARWHAEPGVYPFLAFEGEGPVGYGEVWLEADEAELARILVAPAHRGRGIGRALTTRLADEARRLGREAIWVRVVPDNAAALACYRAAGFVRATAADEAAFNAAQPRAYTWLRLGS